MNATAPSDSSSLPLVAIVGATGTGKSALALDLAEALTSRGHPAEIINADAMQLYRGMDIGTAKVPLEQRRGIPHHLLDVLDVSQEATVAAYQGLADAAIAEVRARSATPLVVGGSGLYVSSILFDFRFPGSDPLIRARLESEAKTRGSLSLFDRLSSLDPDAAGAIGPRNLRRIIRALEVIELTGERFGSGLPDESRTRRSTTIIGLSAPREALVALLDERVERMWRGGLIEEVRGLLGQGLEKGVTARRAIGYAQAISVIRGEMTEETAIAETASRTRRYARRQVGWFRRYPSVHPLQFDDPNRLDAALALTLPHG